MRSSLAVAVLAAWTLAAVPPAGAGTRVYVRIGPPAPVVETRVVAPGPRHVWIAGHHRWDGHGYVWVAGHWALPPAHSRAWLPGHWVRNRHGWYWVDGHWRR